MSLELGFGAKGRRWRREARSLPSTSGRLPSTFIASGRGEIQMFSDLFFFRYGDTWTPWRRCSAYAADQEEMLELEPSSEEAISSVSGYSNDSTGLTFSLLATTTAGRSWGPHGDHTPYSNRSLRNSPGGKLRLRFLSGDQTEGNYILR